MLFLTLFLIIFNISYGTSSTEQDAVKVAQTLLAETKTSTEQLENIFEKNFRFQNCKQHMNREEYIKFLFSIGGLEALEVQNAEIIGDGLIFTASSQQDDQKFEIRAIFKDDKYRFKSIYVKCKQ